MVSMKSFRHVKLTPYPSTLASYDDKKSVSTIKKRWALIMFIMR